MAKKKTNKVSQYINSLSSIDDKIVIITGANSGLGYESSKVALLKGAHLVMACRNEEKAKKAKEALIKETGNDKIDIVKYDQSNFASVREFTEIIKTKYKDFYCLFLNAGIMTVKKETDAYGISLIYKTNFMGGQYLLDLLSVFISESEIERRIIIQGSRASFRYRYRNSEKLIYNRYKNQFRIYGLSKLCCINSFIYFRDLNKNAHVKYLLCEPGVALTRIFDKWPRWVKFFAFPIMRLFTNPVLKGALNGCKLMCDLVANGDYYYPRHFFAMAGLPKKGQLSDKWKVSQIISDYQEMIKDYEYK